jgi:hypothetical protein
MRLHRAFMEGRQLPASLRPFGCVITALCAILCAAPQPAWAAPTTTTTALSVASSGNAVTTVASGVLVTLTATVTAVGSPVAPGQINFCDATAKSCTDIHLLGTAQLTSKGTATFKFHPGIGSHSYQAVFVGTTVNAAGSSAPAALTVTAPTIYPSFATIASGGNAGNYSLTATVLGNGPVSPTGSVSFLNNSNSNAVLGTATLTANPAGLSFVPMSLFLDAPTLVVAGDFNGDGISDLAVPSEFNETVTVLLGNGDGTFQTVAESSTVGNSPSSEAVGDFNGDGKLDLVVVDSRLGIAQMLLGNGDGTFTSTAGPETGTTPSSVAVGDFNGDGKLDLAVANSGSNTVTILLGKGDGTFTPAASPATGTTPCWIAVGDFNGDGKADLAVANSSSNTVTILLGNGDGTFTGAASPATGTAPNSIAAGDFNGDGKQDLAVANGSSNTLTILLGNGDGTFTPTASPATVPSPSLLQVGDFNGDGKVDLATNNLNVGTLSILLGNGDGTFSAVANPPSYYPVSSSNGPSAQSIAVADFNGDGAADIAVAGFLADSDRLFTLLSVSQSATAMLSNVVVFGSESAPVDATYSGDTNYSPASPAEAGLPETLPFSVANTPIANVSSGSSSTSTITLTPNGGFTGSVTLTCSVFGAPIGAVDLPTCSILATVTIAGTAPATAVLTINTQAQTSGGQYYASVTASPTEYPNFMNGSQPSFTVDGPPISPGFLVDNSGSTPDGPILPGDTVTSAILAIPFGGFTGSVMFSCTVTGPTAAVDLPTCTVSAPPAITGTAAVMTTLTVNTTAAAASSAQARSVFEHNSSLQRMFPLGASGIVVASLLFGLPIRHRRWKALLPLLLFAALAAAAIGCGGAKPMASMTPPTPTPAPPANPGTTAGLYTVTVTGASGTIMATTAVTVTVI